MNFLVLIFVIISSFMHIGGVHACHQVQRDSLLSFYRHVSSSPSLDWSSPDCCRWEGVDCGTSDAVVVVTRLSLPGRGLSGKISTFLGNLSFISHLNLSRNSLTGPLPSQLLHRLKHLQVLDLSFNSFTGSVNFFPASIRIVDLSSNRFNGSVYPSFFGRDSSLISLNFSKNDFSGLLPTSICTQARLLQALDFSDNKFGGAILPGIGRCSDLRIFRAGFNSLSGGIPDDFYAVKTLQELSLHHNRLSSSDNMSDIVFLSSLRILELHFNEFSGEIPPGIGLLSNLEQLHLHNNLFNGSLPPSLKDCSNLMSLLLRNNLFAGEISNLDFSKLRRLQTIDLGNNSFSGRIPESLCACSSLTAVRLAYNQFTGDIPACMSSLTLLSHASFTNNNLSNIAGALRSFMFCPNLEVLLLTRSFRYESMPDDGDMLHLNGFQNLQILALAGGGLEGQIPSWISKLRKLRVLNLSYNRLSGPIPIWLGSMPSLVTLNFTHNLFSGVLESELCRFPALTAADNNGTDFTNLVLPFLFESFQYTSLASLRQSLKFGNNNLSGHIPAEIGRLRLLRELDLGGNRFSGTVPDQLSNLIQLERLNLSGNQLSGKIPKSLSRLNFLSAFSVANNDLEGEIVRGGQFDTFPSASFEGNVKLCGSVMGRICENTMQDTEDVGDFTSESRSIWSYDVKIPFGVGFLVGIVTTCTIMRLKILY